MKEQENVSEIQFASSLIQTIRRAVCSLWLRLWWQTSNFDAHHITGLGIAARSRGLVSAMVLFRHTFKVFGFCKTQAIVDVSMLPLARTLLPNKKENTISKSSNHFLFKMGHSNWCNDQSVGKEVTTHFRIWWKHYCASDLFQWIGWFVVALEELEGQLLADHHMRSSTTSKMIVEDPENFGQHPRSDILNGDCQERTENSAQKKQRSKRME